MSFGIASALCVKSSEANLRSGPGTNFNVTWKVYKFMPLKKIKEKGGWYYVKDFDGDFHWIDGKLVTSDVMCAVVKKDGTPLRTGAGAKYKESPVSPLPKNYTFHILKLHYKGNHEWIHVVDEVGNEGWIARNGVWSQ
jgi:SH3-like domain-containing protein